MEEGLFSGEGDNIAAPGITLSRRTSASGHFAFQPLTSRQSTPSSTDSPEAFLSTTTDPTVPSASTSPPFATGFRARSIGTAMLPGTGVQLKGDKAQSRPHDWRSGTGSGPFTVDAGGTNNFDTGYNNSGYTPHAGPSSYNPSQAIFATNLSSSFPNQPLAWTPSNLDPQSYSGTPSPLLSQSYSSYTSFDQSSAAIPIASTSVKDQYISPDQSLASSPRDPALLALHSSFEASQGLNNFGFAQQPSCASQSNGRGRTKSGSRNEPLSFVSISPSQQNSSVFPSPSNSSFDSSRTTYQRPVPPLPRRPSGSGSFRPSSLSNTYQAAPIASTSAVQSFYQPPTPIQAFARTPPISRPVSPRVPGVAYDFTSLEKDLDNFSNGSGGGFASAAAAAMASVGSNNGSSNRIAGAPTVGGYAGVSNGHVPPSPLLHTSDLLSEPFYAKLPARTPSGSNGLGSFAPSPGEMDFFGFDVGGLSGSVDPSPVNSSDSPSSSTVIEDSAEALAKKDPIAAQVWRMFNKAKHSLPNGARMENLTWRLMSMTLKKRREETAAAEAEAAAATLQQEEEEASEARDGVGAGREQSGLQRKSAQLSEGEITKSFAEAEGRGRKGRASSPQSASASESPEGFEE